MSKPAAVNLSIPKKNGGMPLSASCIKKYVEPHTVYTKANAITTIKVDGPDDEDDDDDIFVRIKELITSRNNELLLFFHGF